MKVELLAEKISTWNLRDILLLNKDQNDKGITFIDGQGPDRKVSYSSLYNKSVVLANEIDRRNESGNGYCIILAQGQENFIRSFWGIVLSGRKVVISPLLTEIEDIMELLQKQIHSLKDCYIITTSQFVPLAAQVLGMDRIINIDEFTDDSGSIKPRKYKDKNPDDVSIIQYSSGSTSHPKGVKLSDYNLLYNVYQVFTRLNCTDQDSSINYLPLNHALGLLALVVAPMYLEVEQYHIETKAMLQNPLILPDKIDEYKVTTTASPNIGLKYIIDALNNSEHNDWDLTSLRVFLIGAEPLSWKLISGFFNLMERYGLDKKSAIPAYGMTEAGLAISVPDSGTTPSCIFLNNNNAPGLGENVEITYTDNNMGDNELLSSVSLGYPLEGLSLRICDGSDDLCDDGVAGEIQIKGPNVFKGYVIDNEDVFTQDQWFKTGDIGALINNKLYVFGRLKNMIIANGSNIYLEDIESCLIKSLKIELGRIAVARSEDTVFDNLISIYFEKDLFEDIKFEDVSNAAKKIVQKNYGIAVERIYLVDKIPRTAIGKIARGKLSSINVICKNEETTDKSASKENRERKLHGTKDDIKEALVELIKEETGALIDDPETGFLDAGLDSLKLNILIEELQSYYPELKISDLFEASNINKLCDMLYELNVNNISNTTSVNCIKAESKNDKIAFLFPGQGSLNKESCEKLYRSYEVARKVFDEASEVLGHDVINDFRQGQPELLAASIASYKVLESYVGIMPQYMAGHSLGEYSALCAANVIDFKTALKLTKTRESLMKNAEPGIMAAILGMEQSDVQHFIDEEMKDSKVYCANFNSPKQIVISGAVESVKAAMKELESRGANVIELRTDSASHCPLMSTITAQFESELRKTEFNVDKSEVQIFANVNAELYTKENIVDNLTNQLTKPVLWSHIVKQLHEMGVGVFVDIGPGEILKTLNNYMGFSKEVKSFSGINDIEEIKRILKKEDTDIDFDNNDISDLFDKCLRIIICSPCKSEYPIDQYESLISEPVIELIDEYKEYQETGKLSETTNNKELLEKTIRIMNNKGFSSDNVMELLEHS